MRTAPICSIDCSEYLHKAQKLDARATESFAYAGECFREGLICQATDENKFAKRLRADASVLWDHLYTYHPQEMEDLRSY